MNTDALNALRELILMGADEITPAYSCLRRVDSRTWPYALRMTPFGYDGAQQLQIVRSL